MRRTVTKAPTAMTGPRAKGATAALARAVTEGEAATRDMGPIHAPARSGRTPAGTVPGPGPLIADDYTVEEQFAPQTPHGSPRVRASARQAARTGQSRHSAFARVTSRGDSAKNRSGLVLHASADSMGSSVMVTSPPRRWAPGGPTFETPHKARPTASGRCLICGPTSVLGPGTVPRAPASGQVGGSPGESEEERQASRRRGSGEGEEQLLHLLLGQRGIGVAGQALPHPARHDLEPGPVKRPAHRCKLRDHLGAVPPVLDHRNDPGQLAMGAAEPVEHGASGAVVDLHQSALPAPVSPNEPTHAGISA